MSSPYGVTDPFLRDLIAKTGGNPNDPNQRAAFEAGGTYTGEAPATGVSGFLGAFGSGAFREVENLGRGILDLPLAVARRLGITDFRIDARLPGPLEQANPVGSGLGTLTGAVGSFLIPETALGRLGAIQKLRNIGAMSEAGLGGGRASRALVEAAGGLEAVEANVGLRALLEAQTGRTLFRPTLWSGFGPRAMAARAATAAPAMGLQEFLKSGDIDERLSAGLHGLGAGALMGLLGAPAGLRRPVAMAREAVASTVAFGGQPIIDSEALPGPLQTAAFGAIVGAFRGARVPKDVPSQLRPDWMGMRPQRLKPGTPPLVEILDRITTDVRQGVTPQAVYDELKRQGVFDMLVQTRRRALNEPALEIDPVETPRGRVIPHDIRRPARPRGPVLEHATIDKRAPRPPDEGRVIRLTDPPGPVGFVLGPDGQPVNIEPLVIRDGMGRPVKGLIVPGAHAVTPDADVVLWTPVEGTSAVERTTYTPSGPRVDTRPDLDARAAEVRRNAEDAVSFRWEGVGDERKLVNEPAREDFPEPPPRSTAAQQEALRREREVSAIARRDTASEIILRDVHTKVREGAQEALREVGGSAALREPQRILRVSGAAVERRVEELVDLGWDATDARVQAQDELAGRRPRWDGTPETLTPPEVPRIVEQPPQPQYVAGATPEGFVGPEGRPLGSVPAPGAEPLSPPPEPPKGGEPGPSKPPDSTPPPAGPAPAEGGSGRPAEGLSAPASPGVPTSVAKVSDTPPAAAPAGAPDPTLPVWDRALAFLKPYAEGTKHTPAVVGKTAQMSRAEYTLFKEVLRGLSGGTLKRTYSAMELNTALMKLKIFGSKKAPEPKPKASGSPADPPKMKTPTSMVPRTPREEFRSRGKGHEQVDDDWQKLVQDGVFEEAHVELLHEVFKDTADEFLRKMRFGSKEMSAEGAVSVRGPGMGSLGKNDTLPRGGGVRKAAILLRKTGAKVHPIATLAHEVGHVGYWGLLNNAERALVNKVYNKLTLNGKQPRYLAHWFEQGVLDKNQKVAAHTAQDPDEFFSQAFADWLIARLTKRAQVDKAFVPLFQKVFSRLLNAIGRLFKRKELAEMAPLEPLFEVVLRGENKPIVTKMLGEPEVGLIKRMLAEPDGASLKPEPDPPPLGVLPPRETWFGLPHIDRAVWHALSLKDAYEHTVARLHDPKNSDWGRFGGLFRFALKAQRAGVSSPILDAVLKAKAPSRGLLLSRGHREAFAAAAKDSIDYIPARGVVREQASGLEIPALNAEEAILAAHTLSSLQRRASELGVPLTPDIGLDSGPHAPKFVPLGDIDGSAGELHSQLPPNPEARSISVQRNLRWGPIQRWWHTHLSSGESFFNALGEAIKRTTGEEHSLIKLARRAQSLALQADRIVGDVLEGRTNVWRGSSLKHLAQDVGLPITDETGRNLGQLAEIVDGRMETIRRQIVGDMKPDDPRYPELARQAQQTQAALLDQVIDEVRRDKMPYLLDTEVSFYKRALDEWWTPLYEYLDLDPLEFRFGFFHRLHSESAQRTFGYRADDPLRVDPSLAKFKGALQRLRDDPSKAADPTLANLIREAAEYDAWFVETLKSETSFWEVASAYARHGIRRKLVGDTLKEISKEATSVDRPMGDVDVGVILHGFVNGNIWAQRDVADRLKREVTNLMGFPDVRTQKTGQRVRQNRIALIKNLAKAANWLEGHNIPEPVVTALRKMYRNMGIQLTNGHVQSLGTAYTRLHRGQTFGFNLMAVMRDMASTDLLTSQRLPARYFAPEWARLRLNPFEMVKEYRRLRELNRIDDFTRQIATPQLEEAMSLRPGLRPLLDALVGRGPMPRVGLSTVFDLTDAVQIFYKMSDTGTRVVVHAATERAVRGEFAKLRRSKLTESDLDEFIANTGLAYAQKFDVRQIRNELRQKIADGTANLDDFVKRIAEINVEETAFTFHRIHSAPLMDSTPGRMFLFYGSWPLRALASMYHLTTGPMKNLTDPGARAKAYAKTVIRFSVASQGVFALGAAVNVDTSDWIPFVHNTIPSGGPIVTLAQNVRELMSGDPSMMQRVQKDPTGVITALSRQMFPGIPTVFRRAWSQHAEAMGFGAPSKEARLAWSLPPMQADVWDRFLVSFGFNPYQRPLYPAFKRGGLPSLGMEATFGALQDWLARRTGLPPGTTQEAAGWVPPLKPQSL